MKKLIVGLTLAAVATLSLQAGETKSASCEADSCCAAKAKISKRVAPAMKGGQVLVLLAKR